MISAKIVADSVANNIRITTLELCYPRFIHSEFMTHRMFSRNASSSRAIPIDKTIDQVRNNPAMPVHWGENRPGMRARGEIEDVVSAKENWIFGASLAIGSAKVLRDAGLHKQIVNRVLEPYQFIKVIVTATEWDNFFKLRLHKDAQPEIHELARCMKIAMKDSSPTELAPGEWHLPYVTQEQYTSMMVNEFSLTDVIKCSVARCARVSYLNHDNSTPDISKDIALADMLLVAGHMSPFEHIATPMDFAKDTFELAWENGVTHKDRDNNFWSGNFRGWIQYRQLIG